LFNQSGLNGVSVGDVGNIRRLCGAQFDPPISSKPTVAVFFVPVEASPANSSPGAYNIGLVPVKASGTPIFIDPKVINNGFTVEAAKSKPVKKRTK
jgi:hypothetical protein